MSSIELLGPVKGKHFPNTAGLYSWISYTGGTTVHCSEWSQYCRDDAAAPVPPDVSQQPVVLGFERLALFFVAWILS